jgi:hypothetical protein
MKMAKDPLFEKIVDQVRAEPSLLYLLIAFSGGW